MMQDIPAPYDKQFAHLAALGFPLPDFDNMPNHADPDFDRCLDRVVNLLDTALGWVALDLLLAQCPSGLLHSLEMVIIALEKRAVTEEELVPYFDEGMTLRLLERKLCLRAACDDLTDVLYARGGLSALVDCENHLAQGGWTQDDIAELLPTGVTFASLMTEQREKVLAETQGMTF